MTADFFLEIMPEDSGTRYFKVLKGKRPNQITVSLTFNTQQNMCLKERQNALLDL